MNNNNFFSEKNIGGLSDEALKEALKKVNNKSIPQKGEMVLFYPVQNDVPFYCWPAIVIDGNNTHPSLGVFTPTGYETHLSVHPQKESCITLHPHWDWVDNGNK